MASVKNVGVEFFGKRSLQTFRLLESLSFEDMEEWENWSPNGEFPNLHELSIENCPKLLGKLPNHLPLLKKLLVLRRQVFLLLNVCMKARPTKVRKLNIPGASSTHKIDSTLQSKIKEVTGRFNEIVTRKDQLNLKETADGRSHSKTGVPAPTSVLTEPEPQGRDKDKEAVVDLLVEKVLVEDCPRLVAFKNVLDKFMGVNLDGPKPKAFKNVLDKFMGVNLDGPKPKAGD
ncbi:hypothetical protein FH972_010828 [Carpinus fangiana]|uniref:Uncharacterized protein n=1 Tax=Carpinus fangiana TaxID=176857 RepID=A0A660KPE6_9ROSI|nr:hypothetical protein FH972_010828 [Carpinus fangiana]